MNLLGSAGCEIPTPAWMQRDEVHERLTFARQLGELSRLLGAVVDTAEHHVFEGDTPVEDFGGLDDAGQWILGVDWHQRLAELVTWRVDRYREAELLRTLSQGDDSRENSNRRNGDVPRANAESVC